MPSKRKDFTLVFEGHGDPSADDERHVRELVENYDAETKLPGLMRLRLSDDEAAKLRRRLDGWVLTPEVDVPHPIRGTRLVRHGLARR